MEFPIDETLLEDFIKRLSAGIDPDNPVKSLIWTPLPDKDGQQSPQAMAYTSNADELFYGGAAGGGKALTEDSIIYTPNGGKRMGDLKVGDAVLKPDGGVTRVIKVHPMGVQPIFKLTFDDGATVRATGDHLWNIIIPTNGIRLMTTSEVAVYCMSAHGEDTYPLIPLTQAVYFSELSAMPVSPYYIGQMLGNEKIDMRRVVGIVGERQSRIALERRQLIRPGFSLDEPHIPTVYLYSSAENRYRLIAGILDARATLTDDDQIAFTTPYEGLAQDIQWVARSLGAKARLRKGTTTNVVVLDTAYNRAYFRFHRRLETQSLHHARAMLGRKIIGIQTDGEALARCITIESPEGLFLADDFVVTHNCLTADHEVMTEVNGWKPITDVKVGERVLSWWEDHFNWKPVTALIMQPHIGQMVHYDSPDIKFVATPTHNIPVYRNDYDRSQKMAHFVQAQNLDNESWLVTTDKTVKVDQKYIHFEPYNGMVHCLTVDKWHTFVTRYKKNVHVTGNTDLLLGWAITAARKSIIYRREYPQLKQIIQRSRELLPLETGASYNANDWLWSHIPGRRLLEFGSVPGLKDVSKYQGRPHDFIAFDELSNFLFEQYIFLTGWNRTEIQGQRARIIAAGNPPTNAEGEWVVQRWGAWIDPSHPNPAKPGELRWYARVDDEDVERENNVPFMWKAELIRPRSRTFIPARVTDNPHYGDDYIATLQALPEPLRSKMLYGDFGIVFKDDPWQVIPTAFVRAARERYDKMKAANTLRDYENVNPSFGLDPAEAGKDHTALCKITGNIVQSIQYSKLSDTMEIVRWVVPFLSQRNAPIGIDAIGIGAGIFHRLREMKYRAVGIKVSTHTPLRDRTGQLQFFNLRSALWWLCRDALDPDGLIQLALPPDDKLLRELTSARWNQTVTGLVQVESQEALRGRLGRSPDAANSVMMALFVSHVRRPPLRIV